MSMRCRGFIHHSVPECSQPLDLDLDLISGLQEHLRVATESDSTGRSCEDYIAGEQFCELRGHFDETADVEDEIPGI